MKPFLTVAGLLLCAIGVAAGFILGERTPGLAGVAVFLYLVLGGAVLGAACTVLALARRERWRGLQVFLLLAYLGVAVLLGAPFLRARPVPPIPAGDPAYLSLAPAPARLERKAVVLGYPAPDSPETQRGYVIGERDARGIVASLRAADYALPLQPREFRLQLAAAGGRWTLGRDADHLRELSDRQWKQATFLELRVNPLGWGVPVGVADQDLRPIGAAR